MTSIATSTTIGIGTFADAITDTSSLPLDDEWTISDVKLDQYTKKFNKLPVEKYAGGMRVQGKDARVILDASGLPAETLMAIWELADGDQDGYLSTGEFNIAMHLIDRKTVLKKELPKSIPQTLRDSAWANNNIYGKKALSNWSEKELTDWIAGQELEKPNVLQKAFKGLKGKDFDTLNKIDVVEALLEAGSSSGVADAVYTALHDQNDMTIENDSILQFSIKGTSITGTVISEDLNQDFPYEVKVSQRVHRMKLKSGSMRLVDMYENNVAFKFTNVPSKCWTIPFSKKQHYEHEFSQLVKQEETEGEPLKVAGQDARVCLDASGLDVTYLQIIWKLSDMDEDGCLTLPELMVALFLIDAYKEGTIKELPKQVPVLLVASAKIPIRPDHSPPLEDWTKDQVQAWCEEHSKFKTELPKCFKDMTGVQIGDMTNDAMTERLKNSVGLLHAKILYYDFQALKKYAVLPYGELYFAGVTASAAQKVVENKFDAGYNESLKNAPTLQKYVDDLASSGVGPDIDGKTWDKMQYLWVESMRNQLKNSNFEFNPVVHRFPDTYPFEFNAMPMHIGSWMGDCFGMMQWPMPSEDYMHVLRDIIVNNDVGMIQALGIQNPNERMQMISYWETIGKIKAPREKVGNCFVSKVEVRGKELTIVHFQEWPDYGKPVEDTSDFEYMFKEVRNCEAAGKRILVHCRAGVGRSGTFRLMYKIFRKELESKDLLKEMNAQRALRMWAVQTRAQYNFLQMYNRKLAQNGVTEPSEEGAQEEGAQEENNKRVEFRPDVPTGFDVGKNRVIAIEKEGQANKKGVEVGWEIIEINGKQLSEEAKIKEALESGKTAGGPIIVLFKSWSCEDTVP